jgi:hypothetical protein
MSNKVPWNLSVDGELKRQMSIYCAANNVETISAPCDRGIGETASGAQIEAIARQPWTGEFEVAAVR